MPNNNLKLSPYQIEFLKEIKEKTVPVRKKYVNPYNNCSKIISTFHKREEEKIND